MTRQSHRHRTVYLIAVLLLAIAAAAGAWWLLASDAPSPDGDPVAVARFVGSDDFGKLTDDEKRPYLERLRESRDQLREARRSGELTDEQMRDAMRNSFGGRMRRMDDYFKLPPGPQREAMLDEMIDRMQERRRQWEQRRAENGGEGRGEADRGRRGDRGSRMKSIMENVPPHRKAQFAEFMGAMRDRMEERGIDSPRRGR